MTRDGTVIGEAPSAGHDRKETGKDDWFIASFDPGIVPAPPPRFG